MLVTDRALKVVRTFRGRALCVLHSGKGVAAAAWARAQIDRTQPRAALGGALQYALSQVRDLWSGLDGRSHLAHFVVSLALCAAVRVERIASSSRSAHLWPHRSLSEHRSDRFAKKQQNDIISLLHPLLQQCV